MSTDHFWKHKQVLITGHEGFLGSWLTKILVKKEANVIGVDKEIDRPLSVLNGARKKIKVIKGNIVHQKVLAEIIDQHQPQYIFHLAAEAIVERALKDPVRSFKSNIEGTWNLLEASRGKTYIDGIIVASSDKAYGEHRQLPYKENFSLQGQHPYDVSKSCTDLICQTYYHTYDVPVCITRCGNIYGPGDYHFSRIVPDTVRSIINDQQLVIRSNGKFTRDYIYIEDIVDAYLLLGQKMKKQNLAGQAFNFSGEKPISVLGLYDKIASAENKLDLRPKILNEAKYEICHQYLSAQKARKVLNWQAKHTLDQGLTKTINWYRRNG